MDYDTSDRTKFREECGFGSNATQRDRDQPTRR